MFTRITVSNGLILKIDKRSLPNTGVLEIPEIIDGQTITSIDSYIFRDCKSIKKVIMPKTLSIIGAGCFLGSSIEEVVFKGKVKYIGPNAFCKTKNLQNVYFEALLEDIVVRESCFEESAIRKLDLSNTNITTISERMFFSSDLEEIILPSTVTRISKQSFSKCRNLKKINIEELDNLLTIEEAAFYLSNLEDFNLILKGKTIVKSNAFYKSNLKSLTILSSNVKLEFESFSRCEKLETVMFEDLENSYNINEHTFSNCSSLKTVNIGKGCICIGPSAFFNCPINQLSLPSSLEEIGRYSFLGCDLKELNFSNLINLKKIGVHAFWRNMLTPDKITFPPFCTAVVADEAFSGKDGLFDNYKLNAPFITFNSKLIRKK